MSREATTVYFSLLLVWCWAAGAGGRNLPPTTKDDVDFILSDSDRAWKFVLCITHFKPSCGMEGRRLIAVVRAVKQQGGACVPPCTPEDKELYDYFMERLKTSLGLYEMVRNEV